jgi:hypothetical protein
MNFPLGPLCVLVFPLGILAEFLRQRRGTSLYSWDYKHNNCKLLILRYLGLNGLAG